MISIIIPVYNNLEMTKECINAVRECTTDYEIIVVDNGSEPAFIKPYTGFVDLLIIRNETNKGFPVAINQGIKVAKGDVIVLLNNDVVVTPMALNRLAEWLLDDFAIVGPLTNYCAGKQKVSIPVYNTKEELYERGNEVAEENNNEAVEVNWLIGFCMAFKKSLYEEIGEFDESLWPCSGEEIDFCYKAKAKGHSIGIALDTYVHHFGSQTFHELVKTGQVNYNDVCVRNDKHLAKKWGASFWTNQEVVYAS